MRGSRKQEARAILPPHTDRILNIAHRGASSVAPQNTLAAFEKAFAVGADGIELDVQLSADGVPVVIHDATVDATTGSSGRVDAMTLSELKRLDAGSCFGPAFAGERIPTLAEVLDTMGARGLLNIELKGSGLVDRGLEQAVVGTVAQYALGQQILLSSFNPFALRRAQAIAPDISTALLYAYPSWLALHLASSILPRKIAALHPHLTVVDRRLIDWVRAKKIRVHVWTVDDTTDMNRLIRWGVNGLITNRPDLLRQVLKIRAGETDHLAWQPCTT